MSLNIHLSIRQGKGGVMSQTGISCKGNGEILCLGSRYVKMVRRGDDYDQRVLETAEAGNSAK